MARIGDPSKLLLTLPVTCWLESVWEWKAVFDPDNGIPDGVFNVSIRAEHSPIRVPAHQVRESFLSIETLEDVLRFSEAYGPITTSHTLIHGSFSFALVKEWQAKLAKARELPSNEFFFPVEGLSWTESFERATPTAKLVPGNKPGAAPQLELIAFSCDDAMLFANYLDQIGNIRVATCPQCQKQFELKDGKRKTYCTDSCQRFAGKARWSRKHNKATHKAPSAPATA